MFTSDKQLNKETKLRCRDLGLNYQVGGDGDLNATMVIIGEGPGQQEVNKELAFVGESGKLLWNSLRPYKLYRTLFYVTNVCKRQISLGQNTRHPVSKDEWTKWKHLLQWELEQLPNLRYILAFGNAAIDALFGLEGITKHRGSVYTYRDKQVLCTLNPAAVIREPKNEIIFMMDIRRFNKVICDDFEEYTITKHINPTFKQAREWIWEMQNNAAPVAYDIETMSNETACWGLANSGHEAMCINLRDRITNRYTIEEELQLLYALQGLAEKKPFIMQNGNFDAHWGGYKDLVRIRGGFDTLLAHHTLYPLLPHSLAFLTSQYTTHPFYKDDGSEWREGGNIDSFWEYNCTDAAVTWECARLLENELRSQGLYDFFIDHVMHLDPHLVQSTIDGILVDVEIKDLVAAEIRGDVEKVATEFHLLCRAELGSRYEFDININSNLKIRDLFINKLRLKATTTSVDKNQRQKWLDDPRTSQAAKDILIKYNEYQRDSKFASTYAEMKIDPDNRFRTTWKQQGVTKAPGRLSSSGNLWGTAANAQNQPERAKKFYCADNGTVIIYIDGSQAEARVVGYLADIEKWKEDFERARLNPGSFDAHCSLAADMYKIPYDDVPTVDWVEDEKTGLMIPTIRYKAKRSRHGLNYRMNYPRLAEAAKLSLFEAKKSYILYHQTNPEIKDWWAELEKIVKKDRQLMTPLGRRMKILGRIDEEALESIVAFVPQSTIGDHVKRCWYQSHEDDKWDMSCMRIKLNVHDALIGLATPDKAELALAIMQKYMERPILIENVYKTKVEQCIIPGDVAMSYPASLKRDEKGNLVEYEDAENGLHRWSSLKKLKNFRWEERL